MQFLVSRACWLLVTSYAFSWEGQVFAKHLEVPLRSYCETNYSNSIVIPQKFSKPIHSTTRRSPVRCFAALRENKVLIKFDIYFYIPKNSTYLFYAYVGTIFFVPSISQHSVFYRSCSPATFGEKQVTVYLLFMEKNFQTSRHPPFLQVFSALLAAPNLAIFGFLVGALWIKDTDYYSFHFWTPIFLTFIF